MTQVHCLLLALLTYCFIALPTVLCVPAASCSTSWKSVGPTFVDLYNPNFPVGIGAMTGLALRGDTLYVGSVNGGVWRTDNFHTTTPHYQPLTDQQRCNGITALAVHPTNNQFVVAGCGTPSNAGVGGDWQGVLISQDGGTTWTRGVLNPNQQSVTAALILSDNTILVSTRLFRTRTKAGSYQNTLDNTVAGIYRSSDMGNSWNKVYSGWVYDMQTDATQTELYALGSQFTNNVWINLMYISTDRGQTWSTRTNFDNNVNNGCNIQGVVSVNAKLAVNTVSGTQYLLAVVFTVGTNTYCYDYYYSSDHGMNWFHLVDTNGVALFPACTSFPQNCLLGTQGGNNLYLIPDPTQLGNFYLGGTDIVRYRLQIQDNNNQINTLYVNIFHDRNDTNTQLTNPHSDARNAIWDPTTNNLVETNDAGIWTLSNPRAAAGTNWNWVRASTDFATTEQNSVSYDPTSGIVVAAAQDNSVQFSKTSLATSTGAFYSTGAGDGVSTAIDMSQNPAIFYTGIQNLEFIISWPAGSTLTSPPGDPPQDYIHQPGFNFQSFGVALQDPAALLANAKFAFTAKLKTNPYQSGTFMTCSTSPASCYSITRTSRTPNGKDQITPLVTGQVFQAWNAGGSRNGKTSASVYWAVGPSFVWTRDSTPTTGGTNSPPWNGAAGDQGFRITGLAVHPNDYYQAYATTTESKLYHSTDFGVTWSCQRFPTQPWGVMVIPMTTNNAVLVGTQNGVYVAFDNGVLPWNWKLFGLGLPNVLTTEFVYDTTTDMLIVSTMGRGMWTYTGVKQALNDIQTCATPAQDYFVISQQEGTYSSSCNPVNHASHITQVSWITLLIVVLCSWIWIQ